jgi:hypothetical protein
VARRWVEQQWCARGCVVVVTMRTFVEVTRSTWSGSPEWMFGKLRKRCTFPKDSASRFSHASAASPTSASSPTTPLYGAVACCASAYGIGPE